MAKKKQPTEDKFAPGRHMGRFCGYEVEQDGSILVAPMIAERMQKINERETGLQAMIEAHQKFLADEYERLTHEKKKWWAELAEELPIKLDDDWRFNSHLRRLYRAPKPEQPNP